MALNSVGSGPGSSSANRSQGGISLRRGGGPAWDARISWWTRRTNNSRGAVCSGGGGSSSGPQDGPSSSSGPPSGQAAYAVELTVSEAAAAQLQINAGALSSFTLGSVLNDEALGLPTSEAATLALRTQQVIGHESGVADFVDPLAGSYAVEALTNQIEAGAIDYFEQIADRGGVIPAIEQGWIQKEIERRAYEHQRAVETKQRIVVGVNEYVAETEAPVEIARLDPQLERDQIDRVRALRARRNQTETDRALRSLDDCARTTGNLLEPILSAVKASATVGEIADVLRDVFGEHQPQRTL